MFQRMVLRTMAVRSQKWTNACSAVRGRSHHSSGIPCQDSVLVCCRRGVTVAALADGAGSARHSDIGSRCCVEKVSELLSRRFDSCWSMQDEALQAEAIDCVLGELEQKRALDSELYDYASTLLAVAVHGNRYLCFHLGDGVVGIQHTNESNVRSLQVLSAPENGEFINETFFTTTVGAGEHLRVYRGRLDKRGERTIGFILMSDGPETALYRASSQTLAPACEKLLLSCRRLPPRIMRGRLDATVRMLANKTTRDDCSVVLLAR